MGMGLRAVLRAAATARRERKKAKMTIKTFKHWKIARGDTVVVISGDDKGKTGKVKEVLHDKNAVVVKGINLNTRIIPPTPERKGRLIKREAPIHVSNVTLLDPETQKPSRIRSGFLEDGTKVRVTIKSGAVIPKPDVMQRRRTKVEKIAQNPDKYIPKDPKITPPDLVLINSFEGLSL